MRMHGAWIAALLLPLTAAAEDSKPAEKWVPHTINADSKFEAAGIADVNNDGRVDIVCGAYWYEAPHWNSHKIAELEEIDEYYNDFANLPQDVDDDGDLDIVDCTWFSQEFFWRENPGEGAKEALWKVNPVDQPGNMETGMLYDVNQDGTDDFVPNLSSEVVWYEKTPGKAKWTKRVVGSEGKGHGIGYGDLNSDGTTDFITPAGWYEGKDDENGGLTWVWHPEFELGSTSVPVVIHDVNEDGNPDIVWGLGHDYGLFWHEQKRDSDERVWIKHEIDKSWSQPHYLALTDLNDDGKWEILTGKRYRAHNGHDPGETDPLCVYIYQFDTLRETWTKTALTEGGKIGFGLNPAIGDIDGDGDTDIVCPGKSGLYILEQQK